MQTISGISNYLSQKHHVVPTLTRQFPFCTTIFQHARTHTFSHSVPPPTFTSFSLRLLYLVFPLAAKSENGGKNPPNRICIVVVVAAANDDDDDYGCHAVKMPCFSTESTRAARSCRRNRMEKIAPQHYTIVEQNDHQTDGPNRHTARQCRVLPLLLLHRQVGMTRRVCRARRHTFEKRIPSSSRSSNSSQKRKLLIIFHRFPAHFACFCFLTLATRHGQLQRSKNSDRVGA